jgi:hypothetical protein
MGDATKLGPQAQIENIIAPEVDEEELKRKAAMNNSAIVGQENNNDNSQSKESSSWVSSAKSMAITGSKAVGIGTIGLLAFSVPIIGIPAALVGLAIYGAKDDKGKGMPKFKDKGKPSKREVFVSDADYNGPEQENKEKSAQDNKDDAMPVVSSKELRELQKQLLNKEDDTFSIASKLEEFDGVSVQSGDQGKYGQQGPDDKRSRVQTWLNQAEQSVRRSSIDSHRDQELTTTGTAEPRRSSVDSNALPSTDSNALPKALPSTNVKGASGQPLAGLSKGGVGVTML